MSHRAFASDRFTTAAGTVVTLVAALTLFAAFATPASAMRNTLNAEGDACSITNSDGSKTPGTEKGLECCATADPTNCVVILKPFPGSAMRFSRHG